VLRAMDMPTMDHAVRNSQSSVLSAGRHPAGVPHQATRDHLPLVRKPAPGRPAIVNTLRQRQGAMAETGQFGRAVARHRDKFKLDVDFIPGDWRHGADIEQIEARLSADHQHKIKAVMIVHNETLDRCVTIPSRFARFSTTPSILRC